MRGIQRGSFPHLSWLGVHVRAPADHRPFVISMQSVAHTICITKAGRHSVRWICRGRERRWEEATGSVHFHPADHERHTVVATMTPDVDIALFIIPEDQLRTCLVQEGFTTPKTILDFLSSNDHLLQSCLTRLAAAWCQDDGTAANDEVARRLLIRIGSLCGAGVPDWRADTSSFDRATVMRLVTEIDSSLQTPPALADLALICDISPGHFARKFRQTTGLSVHRFVNRRRIQRSLDLLRTNTEPLAHIALDLGFSSQSHFTRMFSELTGMSPARYRRQCRRAVAMPATIKAETPPVRPPPAAGAGRA